MLAVMLMILTVDVLLLFAAGRLLGGREHPLRILAGGLLGMLFAGLSCLPGLDFLAQMPWRLCALTLSALLTFGASLPKIVLFLLLQLSLSGITGSRQEMTSVLLGAAGMVFACLAVGKGRNLIPVELNYGGQTLRITALRDTGNTLRDPITGKPVLIVGADIAQKLTGLSIAALQDPVRTLEAHPGLRLIPYRTVGNTGFLLALWIPNVKIGNRQGGTVVAFSPNLLGSSYQALTGGMV